MGPAFEYSLAELDEILRPADLVRELKRSRSQIWRDVKAGKFPRPLEIGPNSIGWTRRMIRNHRQQLP